MTDLFLKIVNMSISAGWLVLAVILLRLLLKKAPKWVNVLLWGLVAVRLLCPITVESIFSLIPSAETVSPEIMMDPTPEIHSGISAVNRLVNPVIAESFTPDPAASANPLQIWIPVASIVWILGMTVMLAYTAASYWRLRRRVSTAVRIRDNIYQSERTPSPFVLGIFRPRIYLPFSMDDQDITHVVAHEQTHIRRKDHCWKPLGFLLLTIHWFNPLMWLAYLLLCRDIELACDEKVIKELGRDQRADYSQALLKCSVNRKMIAACPLAFGEVGVKQRVKNVLNYKKPAFWIILVSIAACIVTAVCFLTDPPEENSDSQSNVLQWLDYYQNKFYPEDSTQEFQHPAYPNVVFAYTPGQVTAQKLVTGSISTPLFSGMPIWNVFFTDLSGDGLPEICATVSFGSGIIDTHVVVYDYAAGQEFTLWDRGEYDYVLRIENDNLLCDKMAYPNGEVLASGTLTLADAVGGTGRELLLLTDNAKLWYTGLSQVMTYDGDICYYAFTESEDLMPPSLLLMEDGTFQFTFSVFSSYIGFGKYTVENSRLTLNTDDGMYTYVFDIVSGGLAFDAEASSEQTWFTDLPNGALFEPVPVYTANMLPLESLPDDYTLEQAAVDGCVVIVDSNIRDGQNIWNAFLSEAEQGNSASVRIVNHYTERMGTDYAMEIYDLCFDGAIYSLDAKESCGISDAEYPYLRRFYGEVSDESVDYDACERYILTIDPDAAWEELWRSAASSRYGDLIEHFVVYTDLIYYPDYPQIPDLTKAALELDGETLLTVQDAPALRQLQELLSHAEGLGYEPKTYNLGPILLLSDTSGESVRVELSLDSDLCRIDGVFYDYGPGYTDVGVYNGLPDLFTLLGIDRWPDAVYEKYADYLLAVTETQPNDSVQADKFPYGSIGVWYPDWTYEEVTGEYPLAILESLVAMVLVPVEQPQPDVEDTVYTLHIAYDSGEEFDLAYVGEDRFFYRVFRTDQVFTFISPDLREIIDEALA